MGRDSEHIIMIKTKKDTLIFYKVFFPSDELKRREYEKERE